MSISQSGVHGNVFQIGILTLSQSFSVDKVLTYNDASNKMGAVVVGKVIEADLKPCMIVLNRNKKAPCIIGPNRIYYDALQSQEFKVLVPPNFGGMRLNPFETESQPQIEVYGTQSNNKSIKLANELSAYELEKDIDQKVDPQTVPGVKHGYTSFLIIQKD